MMFKSGSFLKSSTDEAINPSLTSSTAAFMFGVNGGFGPDCDEEGGNFDEPLARAQHEARQAVSKQPEPPVTADHSANAPALASPTSAPFPDVGSIVAPGVMLAEEFNLASLMNRPLKFSQEMIRHSDNSAILAPVVHATAEAPSVTPTIMTEDRDYEHYADKEGHDDDDDDDDAMGGGGVVTEEEEKKPGSVGAPPVPPKKSRRRTQPTRQAATAARAAVAAVAADASAAQSNAPTKRRSPRRTTTGASTTTAVAPTFSSHPKVADAHARLQELRIAVAQAKQAQAELTVPLPAGVQARSLLEQQRGQLLFLLSEFSSVVDECRRIHQSCLLSPPDMYRIQVVEREAFAGERQVALLQKELSLLEARPDRLPPPCVDMVIQQQPFPKSLMQNRVVEEDCVLELLTGAKTSVAGHGAVVAEMVVDYRPKRKDELAIANGQATMDAQSGTARFSKLKFPHGTRKSSAVLKFHATVRCADLGARAGAGAGTLADSPFAEVYVESQPSAPFVVKTNEKQWQQSEALLLRRLVFRGHAQVAWAQFANAVHAHHLLSTRQQLHEPQRALAHEEMEFLRDLFGVAAEAPAPVTAAVFDKAWSWLGPIEHKLRHRRHLSALWGTGMLAGFLSRADAQAALEEAGQPGCFLIRFSERFAGEFVISYLTRAQTVKHYLVRPNEANTPSDTLPDFIRSHADALQLILQAVPATGGAAAGPLGSRTFVAQPVKPILEKFCKPEVESTPWGYEESVVQNLQRMGYAASGGNSSSASPTQTASSAPPTSSVFVPFQLK